MGVEGRPEEKGREEPCAVKRVSHVHMCRSRATGACAKREQSPVAFRHSSKRENLDRFLSLARLARLNDNAVAGRA